MSSLRAPGADGVHNDNGSRAGRVAAVSFLRIAGRFRDLLFLTGRLRQVYWHCLWSKPSPYASTSTAPEDVYGEAFVVAAAGLLKKHGCGPGSTVVDLGCGRGNVLVAARALGAAARGVDANGVHVDAVKAAFAVVDVAVVVGDARDADVAGASHVWLSWATWPEQVRKEVAAHLALSLAPGAVVIGVVYGVDADAGFDVVEEVAVGMSWGSADVVVSRKR